ncbi:MAG: MarR family winged helix-turn-helix transcriptional regulator [Phycisphaerales bacterium JB040]
MVPLREEINKRDPFEVAEQEAYLNLVRTQAELGGEFFSLFKRHGLSEAGYNVLRILRGAHLQKKTRGVRSSEIAGQMVVRVPDVTRLVDRLVDKGLVERTRCTDDRRVVYVAITKAGLKLLEKMDQPVLDLHRSQLGHLSERELASLNKLLEKARRRPDGSNGQA